MNGAALSLYLFAVLLTSASAQTPTPSPVEQRIRIQFVNSPIIDVLKSYAHISKQKLWLDVNLPLDRKVTVMTPKDVSQSEALAIIRGTLLQEGIQIQSKGDSEAFVSQHYDSRLQQIFPKSVPPTPIKTRTPHTLGTRPSPAPTP
jgi:hypothetical protein